MGSTSGLLEVLHGVLPDPVGHPVRYTYDSWGRLSGLSGYTAILAGTIYTPIGQLSQFSRYNGTNNAFSTYGYDNATGQVLQITDNAGFGGAGHYVADRSFTRDKVGNVTSSTVNSVLPTSGIQTTCYTYDGLRELTRAWTPNSSSTCATTPSAGAMGGIAPMWNDYTYDTKTGNRTGLTYRDPMGVASNVTYGYPAVGAARPHAAGTVTGPVDLGSGSYSYDAAGNQTGRPGQTLTFNEVGKVSKIVTAGTTFSVDGSCMAIPLVGPYAGVGVGVAPPEQQTVSGGVILNGAAEAGLAVGYGGGCGVVGILAIIFHSAIYHGMYDIARQMFKDEADGYFGPRTSPKTVIMLGAFAIALGVFINVAPLLFPARP